MRITELQIKENVRLFNVHFLFGTDFDCIFTKIFEMASENKARFDTRLPEEQKQFFERAAVLGGYRSLTDFIVLTVQDRAKEIIEERERVVASQRDKEIFFDALLNPSKPNKALTSAVNEYKDFIGE